MEIDGEGIEGGDAAHQLILLRDIEEPRDPYGREDGERPGLPQLGRLQGLPDERKHRGQGQGIGRAMLQKQGRLSRERPIQAMILSTFL